jgi:hypothetical protein
MVFGLESKLRSWGSGLLGRLSRSRTPSKEELEETQRQKFRDFVRSKYNISDDRLAKLTDVVEYTYQTSQGSKSREEILAEEQEFSRKYKQFQEYAQVNPFNFIAKAIVERVNSLYKTNKGKKSVARIFSELKHDEVFSVGFGYDAVEKRYEVSVNGKTQDIRDLAILQIQKQVQYKKLGVTQEDYRKKRLFPHETEKIKDKVMIGLDFYTKKYAQDLAKFGISTHYRGFDNVMKGRYDISESDVNEDERLTQERSGVWKDAEDHSSELVGAAR